jgi:hypothetical protein
MKPVKHCRHVKEDGIACGSPALRGQSYCHFHLRYKGYPLRTWPNKGRLGGLRFTRRTALNLKAAEASLKRVERALSSGTCADPARARMLRWGLQAIVSDLRRMQEEREIHELILGGQMARGQP